jgi:hypothetical protein
MRNDDRRHLPTPETSRHGLANEADLVGSSNVELAVNCRKRLEVEPDGSAYCCVCSLRRRSPG